MPSLSEAKRQMAARLRDLAWAAGVFELRGRIDTHPADGKPRLRLSGPEDVLAAFQLVFGMEGNLVGPDRQGRMIYEASSNAARRIAAVLLLHVRGKRAGAILETVLRATEAA